MVPRRGGEALLPRMWMQETQQRDAEWCTHIHADDTVIVRRDGELHDEDSSRVASSTAVTLALWRR